MGKVLKKFKSGDKVNIECTDLFVDVDSYVKKYEEEGVPRENVAILIDNNDGIGPDCAALMVDLVTLEKLRRQLQILTSHVNNTDTEEEKFAKIVTSISQNIRYAITKTKNRNVGKNQNFIDGLLKGKCVCIGMSQILKEALGMHGIESRISYSDISEEYGHAWNTVRLGENWYNWDQTNIKSEVLTLNSIGKLLKTDEQIARKKIYRNKSSDVVCNTTPSTDLVNGVNYHAKQNKNKAPKLPKDNFISRIMNRVKGWRKRVVALPEPSIPEERVASNSKIMEIVQQSIVGELEGMNLWKIQTYDRSNVANRIRTSYIGLANTESTETIMEVGKEEFWGIYNILAGESLSDHSYIGNITVVENEDAPKGLLGQSIDSQECKGIIRQIFEIIKKDQLEAKRQSRLTTNTTKRPLGKEGRGE